MHTVLINEGFLVLIDFFFVCSAVLQEPSFDDVTIREGATLKLTCITRNIQDITTSQILDPLGVVIPSAVGVVTVENATRADSGVYTCLVRNTLNNNTINATSTVVIECKLSISRYWFSLKSDTRSILHYVLLLTPIINFLHHQIMENSFQMSWRTYVYAINVHTA